MDYLYVILGGGLGAVLRYLVTLSLKSVFKLEHYSTFWVNVSGCFVMGCLLAIFYGHDYSKLVAFFSIGLVGSYTTFSTFEYENINLIAHDRYFEFIKYSFLSCVCGIIFFVLGFKLLKLLIFFVLGA